MKRKRKVKGEKGQGFRLGWLVVFLVFCAITFGPQVINIWKMHKKIEGLEARKQQLLQENRHLQTEARGLQSDEMVEKIAREELGMIKPGEKVLVKVRPKTELN